MAGSSSTTSMVILIGLLMLLFLPRYYSCSSVTVRWLGRDNLLAWKYAASTIVGWLDARGDVQYEPRFA